MNPKSPLWGFQEVLGFSRIFKVSTGCLGLWRVSLKSEFGFFKRI